MWVSPSLGGKLLVAGMMTCNFDHVCISWWSVCDGPDGPHCGDIVCWSADGACWVGGTRMVDDSVGHAAAECELTWP